MYTEFVQKITELCPDIIVIENEPMSAHTTFRVGGAADVFVSPSIDELITGIELCKKMKIPYLVIGNGSNLLVKDGGIEGVIFSLGKRASKVTVEGNKITAQAGAMLSLVANSACDNSLTGMEYEAQIPGTVGGAVVMNAGAYGGEIKDIITEAKVLLDDGNVVMWSKDDLQLSYRHSRLMDENVIVLEATFELADGEQSEILAKMEDFKQQRVSKQPLDLPSAGSTFKRPDGYFAAKLIDDASLRGYQVGGAQVSEKHTGFVVNKGGATASDILSLMNDVSEKVFKDFGVKLEPEVRIIGRDL